MPIKSTGQGVLAPPPIDFSGIQPAYRTTGTNEPGFTPPPPLLPFANQAPIQWGSFEARPHLLYRYSYGDGIPAAPGEQLKTSINELYPGIFLVLGPHWMLDYTPVLRFYSNNNFRDTWDNAVTLSFANIYDAWTVGFSQSYVSSSESLIQTGSQTDQENYNTALNATYRMGQALSLELAANQDLRFVSQDVLNQSLTDSQRWSTLDWLNYQVWPQLGAAIGVGFGYENQKQGSEMLFQQIQGRLSWHPGEKLSISISGGGEIRQVLNADVSDLINPIFGVTAQYALFESTVLSLGASREVGASYFQNQVTESTSINAQLRQRLLKTLYLDLGGGFLRTSYLETTSDFALNRRDNGTFFNARLSVLFLKRATAAVFYQRTDNTSTDTLFTLSSSQVGCELGYRF